MKTGMNLLLWTVHPNVGEHRSLLQRIRDWGFDGVEFPIAAMTEPQAHELGELADGIGLGRTAIQGLDATEADPASENPLLREAAVEQLKVAIHKTAALGCDLLAGPLFQGMGRFSGEPPTADEWKWAVDTLHVVAEYAASLQIRLALEPLNRFESYLVNTLAEGARFCAEVGLPNVGLLADTHHANIEEQRPAEVWQQYCVSIFHVHISENHRGVPGRGHAIGSEIFQALRKSGYDGWLTIEAFSPKVKALVPRLHVWRDFFNREDEVAVEGLQYIRHNWELAGD